MIARASSHRDALSTTHETQARRGVTIEFTFYKVLIIMLVINVYGSFVLYFHLHYQEIPKIDCFFSKHENNFNLSMHTVEQMTKKKCF